MADFQIHQVITGSGNYVTATGDINISYLTDAAAEREQRILSELQDKVETFWVRSILDPLIESHAWLELDEEAQGGLVDNPLAQTLDLEQAAGRGFLPPGRRADIGDLYFGVSRALLILGEPGSGKTIALIKLARLLLERARTDPQKREPAPVVIPLGGWGPRDTQLRDWVIRQLSGLYFVANGGWLVDQRRIVLLLDGLDEVAEDQQARCARAINAFNQGSGGPGMAVSCRLQDYRNLIATAPDARLRLYGAVSLRPLSDTQIDTYVEGFGSGMRPLCEALRQDAELRTLARTPLMLNVMAVAFQERSDSALHLHPPPSGQDREHTWLFDAYVERMRKRASKDTALPPTPRMLAWLGWLARQTRQRQQPLLQLERLQPGWLERPLHRWLYSLLSRLIAGAVFGAIIALSDWIEAPRNAAAIDPDPWRLIAGLSLGASAGAIMGVLDALLVRPRSGSEPRRRRRALRTLLFALAYLPIWGGMALLFSAAAEPDVAWGEAIGWGLLASAFFAPHTGSDLDDDIRLPELLRWSWSGLGRGLAKGALMGVALAAATTLLTNPHILPRSTPFAVAMLVTGLMLGATAGALFGAFRSEALRQQVVPNQGVRETLKGGVLVLLLTSLTLGLLIGGVTAAAYETLYGLWLGLVLGLCLGAASALWHSGLALIRLGVLRGLLVVAGHTPRGYVDFLNQASDLIFLRRVGGGFQFVHDRLRQYFADRPARVTGSSLTDSGESPS